MKEKCIQITINGTKIQFEGVGIKGAQHLSSIIDELVTAEYNNKENKLDELIELIDTSKGDVQKATLPTKNIYSYIADNFIGNFTPRELSKTLAKNNLDHTKLILPFLGALNHAKVNTNAGNIIITTNDDLNGVVLGTKNNKIILNRNSPDFIANLYKAYTHLFLDTQIKKNLPLKNMIKEHLEEIVKNKSILSDHSVKMIEGIENLNDSYRLRAFLTMVNDPTFYSDNQTIIDKMNQEISADIISRIKDFIEVSKNWEKYESEQYETDLKTYKEMDKRTKEAVLLQDKIQDFEQNYLQGMKTFWETFHYFDSDLSFFENRLKDSLIFKKQTPDFINLHRKNIPLKDLIEFRLNFIKSLDSKIKEGEDITNDQIMTMLEETVNDPENFEFETETFPKNPEQRAFIYNNPEIAAYIYNIVDPSVIKAGTINPDLIIQKLINDHTRSILIKGDISKYEQLFTIQNLNMFSDENSFSEFGNLNSIRGRDVPTYQDSRTLQIKFNAIGDLGVKLIGNILKININSPIKNLPPNIISYLSTQKSKKTGLFIEHTADLTQDQVNMAAERLNEFILMVNNLKSTYTFSTLNTEGKENLGVKMVEVGMKNSLFVNIYSKHVPESEYSDFMSRFNFEFSDILSNVKYNFNQDFIEQNLLPQTNTEISQFEQLKTGDIKGLLSYKNTSNSLYRSSKGSVISISDGNETEYFKVNRSLRLTPSYFNSEINSKKPRIGSIYNVRSNIKGIKNGDYIIYGYDNEHKKYKLTNGTNQIEFTESNLLEHKGITLIEQREVFSFEEGSFIVGNKITEIINSEGNFTADENVINKIYNVFFSDAANVTGYNENYIKNAFLSNQNMADFRVVELSRIDMDIKEDSNKLQLNQDEIGQIIEVIGSKISSDTGVVVNTMNTSQITQMFGNNAPQASAKAFIYEGEIYVNMDLATVDSPLHELAHLILGDLKANSPEIYMSLIEKISNDNSNFEEIRKKYDNLTEIDLREEILAHIFSDYYNKIFQEYGGLDSMFDELNLKGIVERIFSLIDSVDIFTDNTELMTNTISETLEKYQSRFTQGFDLLSSRGSESSIFRKITNVKQKMFDDNELKEICQ